MDKAEKAAYVSSQGQDREHVCHWPGCTRPVSPALWGCRQHWMSLPKALRDKIWATYEPGQEQRMDPSIEYIAAAREIQDWIKKNGEKINA